MDWAYNSHSVPKRRLFIDSSQDTRLNVPSPIQPITTLHQRTPLRSSSSHSRAHQDKLRIQSCTAKGTQGGYSDSQANKSRSTRYGSENVRPNESGLSESVLLNFQRQEIQPLSRLLRSLGLQDYEALFQEHQITQEDLPLLTRDDLSDMGIPIGPRNRILNALQAENVETPQSSRREPSGYQASPGSSCSSKSGIRLKLNREVQQFLSVVNSSDKRTRPSSKPPVVPDYPHDKPQDSTSAMTKLIEDLARQQDIMMKAIEQNTHTMRVLVESRSQSRVPSPGLCRPRSASRCN
jgi:hypothetical protein